MPKVTLTPEEKSKKKARDNLAYLCNSLRSALNFGTIHTWNDVYKGIGYDPRYILENFTKEQREKSVVYGELNTYLLSLQKELEERQSAAQAIQAPKQITPNEQHILANKQTVGHISNTSSNSIASVDKPKTNGALQQISEASVQEATVRASSSQEAKGTTKQEEQTLTSDNDYGLPESPNEKAFLYWFQKKAIREVLEKVEAKKSVLVVAGTGKGKTFIGAGVIRRLKDICFEDGKTISHIPYLLLTRKTIVVQTQRVYRDFFGIDPDTEIEITNIETIRNKAGKFWIVEQTKIVDGEEVKIYIWKPRINPVVVLFDESQAAKNPTSKQHKIMCAYNDLRENNILISMSATPFTRVSEAKCFAVSTHASLEPLGYPKGTLLNNNNWPSFAQAMCNSGSPEDYNETSVGNLMKYLEDYVVRVKGVRPQFAEDNKIEKIEFQTKEEREFYAKAMDRFRERKAKLERDKAVGSSSEECMFTIIQQFSMAAELCRARQIAERMYKNVQQGFAACAAVKFKTTLIAVEQYLENDFKVSRDNISLIWGGGQTELTAKQKAKKKLKEMKEKLEAIGTNVDELMVEMELDQVEDRELLKLPSSSRLGPQSQDQRQIEIDRFQSGQSLYCIYTFKAGGVGLSLHHTDELCTDWNRKVEGFEQWFTENKIQNLLDKGKLRYGQCRRKESGYAMEQDIRYIFTRPRRNIVAPTYSAIELVQGLGRCPRLTSLSVTEQILLFYTGTIEDSISEIVSAKLRCLSYCVQMKESWMEMIEGTKIKEDFMETTRNIRDDDGGVEDIDITTEEEE